MQYGFAIDQRTCIGCHACTVACKTEHEVPLGQFRTWVKYVDGGTFPDTTRSFGVMRCNHCTDAPCVKICPTQALFKREDGIVDFDNERCIGCKSCMQACPYDAIYIDAETHTAAKCNMCAHRVDEGLEPACVVVCPTHSIWVGDLDDPSSGIARLVATQETAVRSPEQNTGPNVFYLGADRAVLDPLAAPVDDTYIWAKPDAQRLAIAGDVDRDPVTGARTTLNTAHPRPWGWKVVTYLWTKGVGAGALGLALLAHLMGIGLGPVGDYVAPVLGLFGAATTGVLLVWDLKRPERFLYIFLKSNWTSWLVIGAYVLTVFSGGAVLWMLAVALDLGWAMTTLAWVGLPVSALMAAYTAFLFGQAEGRDLWQSPLLFWHLVVQAVMVGSGALAVAGLFADLSDPAWEMVTVAFVLSTAAHLLMLGVEYAGGHASRQATVAAHIVTRGRYARLFWLGAVLPAAAAVVLGALTWGGLPVGLLVVAGIAVQPALVAYESAFVRAGQDPPLS
ncbi:MULTISPECIES: 4Fe-4S dicluster domain-containing protein [unclassified Nocardioides]|uniref:4Fe-4S dicluster domain-containing protein n=1 Tax=unclassified Nocardioides TaxID=2615069 RepID=UPI0000EB62B1|nr:MULTISPECIES: 4Fe-4S dicluster domain-containing protein [unclassified Nocardioides]ABL82435.1 4Fe-4S ferredoxin, iron-sulfur binding domain protein [Nocardioides sp. JS614]